jgi:hypothetical protein
LVINEDPYCDIDETITENGETTLDFNKFLIPNDVPETTEVIKFNTFRPDGFFRYQEIDQKVFIDKMWGMRIEPPVILLENFLSGKQTCQYTTTKTFYYSDDVYNLLNKLPNLKTVLLKGCMFSGAYSNDMFRNICTTKLFDISYFPDHVETVKLNAGYPTRINFKVNNNLKRLFFSLPYKIRKNMLMSIKRGENLEKYIVPGTCRPRYLQIFGLPQEIIDVIPIS